VWSGLDRAEQGRVDRRWREVYGSFWSSRAKTDFKAEQEYARCDCHDYYVGPLPGSRGGLGQTYYCHGEPLPGVVTFPGLEAFVAPTDLSWTMIFHHEGQFFLRAEWIYPKEVAGRSRKA
jgi:hypothetical protein